MERCPRGRRNRFASSISPPPLWLCAAEAAGVPERFSEFDRGDLTSDASLLCAPGDEMSLAMSFQKSEHSAKRLKRVSRRNYTGLLARDA